MIITLATSKYWKKGKKKHCSKAFQLGNYIATIIMNEKFPLLHLELSSDCIV
jgi:hypothetical protein